jgi:hypothetical protein
MGFILTKMVAMAYDAVRQRGGYAVVILTPTYTHDGCNHNEWILWCVMVQCVATTCVHVGVVMWELPIVVMVVY